ncbi:hypothetical protein GF318_05115 [Candidatus Micrarchaeota archaeon]|nr:hypothetical protein [Candidatus Micrarchaeota archaeon]
MKKLYRELAQATFEKRKVGNGYRSGTGKIQGNKREYLFRARKQGGSLSDWRAFPGLKEGPDLGDLETHEAAADYMKELPDETELVMSVSIQGKQVSRMHIVVVDPLNQPVAVSSWEKEGGFGFQEIPADSFQQAN